MKVFSIITLFIGISFAIDCFVVEKDVSSDDAYYLFKPFDSSVPEYINCTDYYLNITDPENTPHSYSLTGNYLFSSATFDSTFKCDLNATNAYIKCYIENDSDSMKFALDYTFTVDSDKYSQIGVDAVVNKYDNPEMFIYSDFYNYQILIFNSTDATLNNLIKSLDPSKVDSISVVEDLLEQDEFNVNKYKKRNVYKKDTYSCYYNSTFENVNSNITVPISEIQVKDNSSSLYCFALFKDTNFLHMQIISYIDNFVPAPAHSNKLSSKAAFSVILCVLFGIVFIAYIALSIIMKRK